MLLNRTFVWIACLVGSLCACSNTTKSKSHNEAAVKQVAPPYRHETVQPKNKVAAKSKKQRSCMATMMKAPAKPKSTPVAVPRVSKASPHPGSKTLQHPLLGEKKIVIVLDAGHGGYDLGAKLSSTTEKALCLSTAELTKKYLTEMGYRVIMTRSRDVFIPLEKRTSIANDTKSQLFVSLHFNAAKSSEAKGVEVFYYDSKDKFRSGASKKLARNVLSKVIDKTGAHSRGVKGGNFYVIRETKMPAILVEGGFITHEEEGHMLKDSAYREKLARGVAEGVDNFFKG